MGIFHFDTYIASWDNVAAIPRYMYYNKSQAEHQHVFKSLSQNYRPITVSGSTDLFNQPNYCSVWEKNDGRYWETRHGIPGTDFQAVFDDAKKRGSRPVFIDGFTKAGKAMFNSIWEKDNNFTWNAEFGIADQDYQSKFDQRCREGLRLLSCSPYVDGNQLKYVTVWDNSPCNGWAARHGMSLSQFNEETDRNNQNGSTLIWAKSVRWKGNETFAAIWVKYAAIKAETRQAIDLTSLLEYHKEFKAQGLSLRMLSNTSLGQEYDAVLKYTLQQQVKSNWCWAACASAIAAFYGIYKSQCELVSWDFGILGNNPTLNCCLDDTDGAPCNNGGDLARILDRMNLKKSVKTGHLTFAEIQAELKANRPIGMYIVWNGGGHHVIVITGCQMGQLVKIADPSGNTPYWMSYSAMTNNSRFDWQHSVFSKKPN